MMNILDAKKAKEKLKMFSKTLVAVRNGKELKCAVILGIEALEKQITKKPNRFDGYYCPNCKGKLARQTDLINQEYCHNCGQKIDWKEVE